MATTGGVPQDNMQTGQTQSPAGTTAAFGESSDPNLGQRLDYSKPVYQDLWAFILFYVHVAIIIGVAVYFWGVVLPEELEEYDSSEFTPSPINRSEDELEDDVDVTGVWVVLLCALGAGVAFGILWLQLIKMFAEQIIKIMLFVSIACWGLLALLSIVDGDTGGAIYPIIFCLITMLYTWCIWSRIPFAGACLSVASQIVQTYGGTVWIALLTVFLEFVWIVIWVFAFWAYFASTSEPSGIVMFLLFISLYWGTNVWRNVSHTTTCGVAATWYFSSGKLDNPSRGAFKRTMTTSFGSVAFGSLLVAVLQAMRAMLRGGKRGGVVACIAICLLACIERIMRYFNKYAFVQVATYGCSFFTAAKNTWGLFMSKGIMALINDDLTGLALTCGAVLGAVVSGLVGYVVAIGYYDTDLAWVLAVFGALLGYIVVVIILLVVASGVVAIFVLFAEDPAAMSENRPDEFRKLTEVSPTMQLLATTGSGETQGQAAV